MAKTYEFDHKGQWYELEDDLQSGGLYIHKKQDLQPVIEQARAVKNSGLNERRNKKTGMLKYATIPPVVEALIMQKYGVKNIYTREFMPKLLKIIDTEYPHLKCTEMKHRI